MYFIAIYLYSFTHLHINMHIRICQKYIDGNFQSQLLVHTPQIEHNSLFHIDLSSEASRGPES